MRLKYWNWYSQATGAAFGIMACIYGYLNGFMCVFLNDPRLFYDEIGFLGVVSSYTLIPLCIINMVFAGIMCYSKDIYNLKIYKYPFLLVNKILVITTVLIGFAGTRYGFIIPALLLTFNQYDKFNQKQDDEEDENNDDEEYSEDDIEKMNVT
jgi:hypothetical protein